MNKINHIVMAFLYTPTPNQFTSYLPCVPSPQKYKWQKRKHMLKSDEFTPDLPCQGALQLSCRDLHQLNIYTIWMLYYRVMMSLLFSLTSISNSR